MELLTEFLESDLLFMGLATIFLLALLPVKR